MSDIGVNKYFQHDSNALTLGDLAQGTVLDQAFPDGGTIVYGTYDVWVAEAAAGTFYGCATFVGVILDPDDVLASLTTENMSDYGDRLFFVAAVPVAPGQPTSRFLELKSKRTLKREQRFVIAAFFDGTGAGAGSVLGVSCQYLVVD